MSGNFWINKPKLQLLRIYWTAMLLPASFTFIFISVAVKNLLWTGHTFSCLKLSRLIWQSYVDLKNIISNCNTVYSIPDVVPMLVRLLAKCNGTVDTKVLVEECWGWQPHPITSIEWPVSVQKQFLKHLYHNGILSRVSGFKYKWWIN